MPKIELTNCTKCFKCVNDCPSDAIDIELGSINDTCIHCGHCVAICPQSTVIPDNENLKTLQQQRISSDDFQNLSASVRTCRSFKDVDVDKKLLGQLVDNMKHYPSASNKRPIEISIINSRDLISKLNKQTTQNLIKRLSVITSPVLKPILSAIAPGIDIKGLDKYKKRLISRETPEASQICHHAPVVMLFHAPYDKFGMADSDAYIWATYTSLYANTLGLGTCFNGLIIKAMEKSKAMRDEFKIPSKNKVYTALLIGHPKVKYTNEAGRIKPIATVV